MPTRTQTFDIPYLPESAYHTVYDNGYQFIYVPKRGDVFNVSTWVRTGSIHEDEANNGVSHFLEHLMFKGTERFAPGEFDKAMESMGAIINAATWKDYTFYYVTGPTGTARQNFTKALDMHADMMICSTLPDEEIGEQHDPEDTQSNANKRERGVVIEEIGMRLDQPWTKVYNALNHMMYPTGHPYQRDVIGTPQIIGHIPRESIEDYYHTWYSPGALATIVVGDFDHAWLEGEVLKAFDFSKQKLKAQPKAPPAYPTENAATELRYDERHGDYQTAFFMMGFHGPRPDDLKATIAVDVASRVLGEGRSSRLYQTFLEKPDAPVFNTISCGQSTFKLGNVFFVQANFNDHKPQPHINEVQAEIERFLTTEPVTEAEFARAVKKMKVEFAENSETASGIADLIGENLTVTGTVDGYTRYLEVLSSLTLADVREAAAHWFALDKAYTAVLLPAKAN